MSPSQVRIFFEVDLCIDTVSQPVDGIGLILSLIGLDMDNLWSTLGVVILRFVVCQYRFPHLGTMIFFSSTRTCGTLTNAQSVSILSGLFCRVRD